MRIRVACAATVAAVLAFASGAARANTMVSNLTQSYSFDQTTYGVFEPASSFTTDGANYQLDDVTLSVHLNQAGPSGQLHLYSDNAGLPGTLLEDLDVVTPTGSGLVTFHSSGTQLAANTRYWLTLTSPSSGDFQWNSTFSTAETSPGSWTIGNDAYYRQSSNLAVWNAVSVGPANETGLFSVDATAATAVPTPAAAAGGLALLGGLAMKRRRPE